MYDISENFPPPEIPPFHSAVLPRARIFHIRLHGLPFFAIRFRSPGDVQIPAPQPRAPLARNPHPVFPIPCGAPQNAAPLRKRFFPYPAFGESKGGFLRAFPALPAQIRKYFQRARNIFYGRIEDVGQKYYRETAFAQGHYQYYADYQRHE